MSTVTWETVIARMLAVVKVAICAVEKLEKTSVSIAAIWEEVSNDTKRAFRVLVWSLVSAISWLVPSALICVEVNAPN